MSDTSVEADLDKIALLDLVDQRLRWRSSWTIHNANHIRPSRDALKVGVIRPVAPPSAS